MATLIPENLETVAPTEADALLARVEPRPGGPETRPELERPHPAPRRRESGRSGRRAGVRDAAVPASAHRDVARERGHPDPDPRGTDHPAGRRPAQRLAALRRQAARRGKIPFRTVGKYRRVRFDDLMAYKRKDDEARAKVLDELTAEAQELGMGY